MEAPGSSPVSAASWKADYFSCSPSCLLLIAGHRPQVLTSFLGKGVDWQGAWPETCREAPKRMEHLCLLLPFPSGTLFLETQQGTAPEVAECQQSLSEQDQLEGPHTLQVRSH